MHDRFDAAREERLEAERLRDVQVRGDVIHVPAEFPYGLALVAGVAPRGAQKAVYDSNGPIAFDR